MILLSTAYLAPIEQYSLLLSGEQCMFDLNESYPKQSYRNRCRIMTRDGAVTLSVPVVKHHFAKTLTRDTEIDYSTPWQKRHWHSLTAAYRNSPYFDHYEHIFAPFYSRRERFLADLNEKLMTAVLECMGASGKALWSYADDFIPADNPHRDMRFVISPKPRLTAGREPYRGRPYYQVFSDTVPFHPNLSIIDLLFCEGPESIDYL